MATILLALCDLRFGHEANPPINVRQVGRDSDIAALAGSIRAHGLIQHLEVQRQDGVPYVADGNRRLAALRLLEQEGHVASDVMIPCDLLDHEADAVEISLAANVMRTALHPADEYVAFSDLASRGLDEGAIAVRFGIEPPRVRRILALGRLAPGVIQAWRNGAFDDRGLEDVAAFSLAPSIDEQERVLALLLRTRSLYAHAIRHALGASDSAALTNLKIVGKDAYLAAGGTMIEDLFGDHHVIGDTALLQTLATEKVAAVCKRLVESGWSWAAPDWELPNGARWSWGSIPAGSVSGHKAEKARRAELQEKANAQLATEDERAELHDLSEALALAAYSKAAKASSGVIVWISNGRLTLTPGKQKPSSKAKPAAGAKGDNSNEQEEDAAPSISNALHERLSVQLTLAIRKALEHEPIVGLAALLAGLLASEHYAPIKVRANGHGTAAYGEREAYATAFRRVLAMTDADRMTLAAGLAGTATDMVRHSAQQPPLADEGIATLVGAMSGMHVHEAITAAFDADDYFKSVSRAVILHALGEAGLAGEGDRKAAKMPKAELVAFATTSLPQRGWLPPELRTVHYAGPGRQG